MLSGSIYLQDGKLPPKGSHKTPNKYTLKGDMNMRQSSLVTLFPLTRSSFATPYLEEFDKLFNELFSNTSMVRSGAKGQSPKINAYKKDGKYCIDAVTPFATKDDIQIEIDENTLKITVNSHQDKEVKEDDYLIREVSRGLMVRVLTLGEDVDIESGKSSFKDGVLHIEFDAKAEELPSIKKIAIE